MSVAERLPIDERKDFPQSASASHNPHYVVLVAQIVAWGSAEMTDTELGTGVGSASRDRVLNSPDSVTRSAICLAAVAVLFLGALNLLWRDPLLQWQPMTAGSPWRTPFAMFSGAVLILGGGLMLTPRHARLGASITATWILIWTLALQVPTALSGTKPIIVALLGLGECLAMALGIATLVKPWVGRRGWRIAFGLCLLTFGVSHFAFAEFTAAMVPHWLPARLAIAYLTGAIHAGTGLAILLGTAVPFAAALEAAMMTSFVVLIHIPRVLAAPGDRTEQTMLAVALTLSASTLAGRGQGARADARPPSQLTAMCFPTSNSLALAARSRRRVASLTDFGSGTRFQNSCHRLTVA